jgi:HK97 gp10 family phage protein
VPVTVRVEGAQELAGALGRAQTAIAPAVRRAMQQSLLLIEADARRNVAHDTRQLMNSITSQITEAPGGLVGKVGPSVAYGLYVERGTRPHWPPLAALVPWARRHGIPARAVQVAIARRGTRARPFLQPAFDKNKDTIVALFAAAGQAVTVALAAGSRARGSSGPSQGTGGAGS